MEENSYKNNKIHFLEKIKNKIKKLEWQDWVFICIVIFIFILNFNLISEFKALPSPIYGGDLYYHLGMMNHFDRGGSIFKNSQILNETPWAPFFYQGLISIFSKILSADIIKINLYSSLFFLVISLYLIYIFTNHILKNKLLSLLPVIYFSFYFPIFKYREFAYLIIMPLFLYYVLIAIEKGDIKYFILAGICYGLVGITHTIGFLVATIFLMVLILYLFILKYIAIKENITIKKIDFEDFLKKNYKKFIILLIIGLVISQIYWFKPIFVYHLKTVNTISEYDQLDLNSTSWIKYILSTFVSLFLKIFDFGSITSAFGSIILILSDLGIVALFLIKNKKFKHTYIIIMLVAMIISSYHWVVSIPILGKEFFSTLMPDYIYITLKPILACFGVFLITNQLKNKKEYSYLIICLLLFIFMLGFLSFNEKSINNKWYSVARNDLPLYTKEVSGWIKSNTNVDDVFLTTNEIGFMLNGVTGNKVMNSRRAHSGMWVDVDKSWVDSAIILYGNNSILRRDLINKYKIKYLYWQYDWIDMDYSFDKNGTIVGWFDPLLIRDIQNYSKYLSENGVNYIKIKTWLDPTNRYKEEVKKYDALLVIPSRINQTNPWSELLDKDIVVVKEFYENGYTIARIFKFE